jgi:hypothetical protein
MKAILEFDLSNIEDKYQHLRCAKVDGVLGCIWDIQQLKRKYEGMLDGDPQLAFEDCIDSIWFDIASMLEKYNVNLEELGYE